ncbi:MAG: NAD(+)/NADH kinase [Spirochaetales bacterium]|nr:NAD(+)/NADH kinase [Spirochaetales bacterium]
MAVREIRKVVVLANSTKAKVQSICDDFLAYLSNKGIESHLLMLSSTVDDLSLDVPECDLAVSLGGDGTVLTCAVLLRGRNIPILAVNMGTFGYIAETPVDEIYRVFEEYKNGETDIYSRMMLDVDVRRDGRTVFSSSSLNDVTVSAISHARMARMDLYVNDVLGARLKGDGIIMATPTGSTAYSLAAGGPILDASLDAIIINPICPFTMSVRPLVVNKGSRIRLDLPRQNTEVSLTCDGHEVFSVVEGDEIHVFQGINRALFVENSKRRFIEVLREKLGWAGGFNA